MSNDDAPTADVDDAFGVIDRLNIQNVYAKYCFALDSNDLGPYLDCFTGDALVKIGGLTDYHGHVELRAIIEGGGPTRARHQYLNLEFLEQRPGFARARAYFMLLARAGYVSAYGEYLDEIVQESDGVWRWSVRDIIYLWKHENYNYGR